MNNSVFGKTVRNFQKYKNVNLINNDKRENYAVS